MVEYRLEDGHENSSGGRLMLSEEWKTRKRQGRGVVPQAAKAAGAVGAPRVVAATMGASQASPSSGADLRAVPARNKCHYCSKPGRWTRECRTRIADEAAAATANLVQADVDGGPAMLLANVQTVQESSAPPATTDLITADSVQEARSPSMISINAVTPTTTFSRPVD